MFCPNCGQKTNYEQVYCRSCGAELGETSHKMSKYYADLEGKTDWLKRIGLFSIGLISNVILILGFMIFSQAFRLRSDAAIIFFMLMSCLLTGFVSVLYFEKKRSKKVKREFAQDNNFAPHLIEIRKSNRELNESTFQPIGSVTDHTTELFTAKIPRTRTSGELG